MIAPRVLIAVAALAASAPFAAATPAHQGDSVVPLFDRPIPNLPDKHMVGIEVRYEPGGFSPPHWHARTAFIHAYVLEGSVRSQVEGEPEQVFGVGQSWFESPGAHHVVSANASATQPARLLVTFIADRGDEPLTTFETK